MTRKPTLLGRSLPLAPVAEPAPPSVAPPLPSEPAPAPIVVTPVAGADVLALQCQLLAPMPLPTTLHCVMGEGRQFIVTTSRVAYTRAMAERQPAFVGGELVAMAVAAVAERAWPVQLGEWLDRKAADPSWKLTVAEAIGADLSEHARSRVQPWTIGRLFARLGVSLRGVEISEG